MILNEFREQGYFINQFDDSSALLKIKEICIQLCKETFPEQFTTLENYHLIDCSNNEHDELQYKIFSSVNKLRLHHQFVQDNLAFFVSLFGPDIDLQTQTYVRMVRPGSVTDNIGMHRDIDYGNSAFEVSLSLPLVDQAPGCGLNVVPKSHKSKRLETKQVNREDVERGTPKNEMGFLYAPKQLVGLKEDDCLAISLPFGSGLGFTLGLIHGQENNTSNMTRWSIDFRIKI